MISPSLTIHRIPKYNLIVVVVPLLLRMNIIEMEYINMNILWIKFDANNSLKCSLLIFEIEIYLYINLLLLHRSVLIWNIFSLHDLNNVSPVVNIAAIKIGNIFRLLDFITQLNCSHSLFEHVHQVLLEHKVKLSMLYCPNISITFATSCKKNYDLLYTLRVSILTYKE